MIAKPLEEGETRENDIPAHWKMEEFRNKNRMLLSADLDLDEHKLGNLPVIEMKNHVLTEEELKELVEYFAEGETLYECQPYTKDVYEEVISRIENKEGIYASSILVETIDHQAVRRGRNRICTGEASDTGKGENRIYDQICG